LDRIDQTGPCEDECPVKIAADIIGGKWTTLVVRELLSGKKRYSQIQKALTGISPKILTARLRLLESKKLLTRTAFPTIPPTTEYELTATGRKLEKVLREMAVFGSELKKLEQDQVR
jgi:DNA-binding HxlR family transcriptional regulator